MDSVICFVNTSPLDSDLSDGKYYRFHTLQNNQAQHNVVQIREMKYFNF